MTKTTEFTNYTMPDGQQISFPVAKVCGARPGPKLVVTAGIHGCEYPAIVAAIRLFQELNPAEIAGEVTIIPICSVEGFEKRSAFVSPADGKNPNRVFPGTLDGSYTDALAYHLFNDFISKGDFYLDLHGGDLVEALEPFSIYHGGENNQTEELSRQLVEYYGLPHIVMTKSGGSWDDSGTTYANAAKAGIPAAIVEVGGIGQLEQADVEMHLQGLRNVLRHFQFLAEPAVKPANLIFYKDFMWLRSPVAGIFYHNLKVGDKLTKGQKIGQVEDYFGNLLAEITAPDDGNLLFLTTSPAIGEQGLILGLGVV